MKSMWQVKDMLMSKTIALKHCVNYEQRQGVLMQIEVLRWVLDGN